MITELKTPELNRGGFSGHETFVFRYGWLKKAVDGIRGDSGLFTNEDAIVTLGIGKNMVQSLRHWALASGIIEENGKGGWSVSEFGERLLIDWDPYLEDLASLWLLHWKLVNCPQRAMTWNLAFTHWPQSEFSKESLADFIKQEAGKSSIKLSENTLNRDIDTFVRTYSISRGAKKGVEETFDCPLVDLDLLQPLPDGKTFRFRIGPKPRLPLEILAYTILDYAERHSSLGRSIPLNALSYGPNSPGQAFKLDENSILETGEALNRVSDGALILDDTAGMRQIFVKAGAKPFKILAKHRWPGNE